ncbi:unnamed protein product [Rotaria sp. Silwood2]|nr:unnamed protein product [Rotaria sp. Silwood2]
MNLNVSKSTISHIANKLGKEYRLGLLNNQKPKFYRRRHVATPATVRRITSYISKENPPTISLIAARCNISVGTAVSIIRHIIHAKYGSRLWHMYRRLCNEKYKSYLTTDEAWFYFDASQGVRDIYYVRSNGLPEEVKKIERNDLHPVAVLV